MITFAALFGAGLAAGQGQALAVEHPAEPALTAIAIEWAGQRTPLVERDGQWIGVLGVDLEATPGSHPATATLTYADGRTRTVRDTVEVAERRFPTTELTVEPRYVDLSAADQARADRESGEIAAAYAPVTPEAYWSLPFDVPIPGATDGRNFGHRRVFNGQARAPHSGADLTATTGTPIRAANRGRVVLAKDLFFSGNAVFVDHGLGVYSTYLHLSEIRVAVGDIVERGQVVGLAGATGRVTGPHLHWGARVGEARVDPFSLLTLDADR